MNHTTVRNHFTKPRRILSSEPGACGSAPGSDGGVRLIDLSPVLTTLAKSAPDWAEFALPESRVSWPGYLIDRGIRAGKIVLPPLEERLRVGNRLEPVEDAPRIGQAESMEMYEADHLFEPGASDAIPCGHNSGEDCPQVRYNHPEYFRAGTKWLKDRPKVGAPLIGETKFSSLDSEARTRGESRDAMLEDEDGEPYSPVEDVTGMEAWRREQAEDEAPYRPEYVTDNSVILGRLFLRMDGLSKLEADVLEAVYFRDVTSAAIRLGLTEKAVQNIKKKALQKCRGKRKVSKRMLFRYPIGPAPQPVMRQTQSGYWHQVSK